MMRRRRLLLGILVYVALDLSFAEMPGAFVFDPAGSVESVDATRTGTTVRTVVLPTLETGSFVLAQQPRSDLRGRLPHRGEIVLPGFRVVSCLPRAACAPASPSEDPH